MIRDGVTAYLSFIIALFRPYKKAVPMLRKALAHTGHSHVVDLCAGGGGPWSWLLPLLRTELEGEGCEDLTVELTDKYPNKNVPAGLPEGVTYNHVSIDATALLPMKTGFRTTFTALHHFPPEMVEKILADAVEKGEGIGTFECTRRNLFYLLYFLPMPILIWLTLPFMRGLKWQHLVFSYIIPIIPFILTFDGIVSCLRTYSPEESLEIAKRADPDGKFNWQAGSTNQFPVGMVYLLGVPKLGVLPVAATGK